MPNGWPIIEITLDGTESLKNQEAIIESTEVNRYVELKSLKAGDIHEEKRVNHARFENAQPQTKLGELEFVRAQSPDEFDLLAKGKTPVFRTSIFVKSTLTQIAVFRIGRGV